ncbi:MAG: hypothetical protein RL038_56 [Actinomycetota bacterium]
MEIVKDIALVLHFIGLAALFGGWMTQLKAETKLVTPTMMHGAYTMLASALVLGGLVEEDTNHIKLAIKGLVLIGILALLIAGKRKDSIDKSVYFTIGLLTFTNIFIAVFVPGTL